MTSGEFIFYFILFIYFLERGEGRERERERNIDVRGKHRLAAICMCPDPTGDRTQNPGMCPNQESSWQPFGLPHDA